MGGDGAAGEIGLDARRRGTVRDWTRELLWNTVCRRGKCRCSWCCCASNKCNTLPSIIKLDKLLRWLLALGRPVELHFGRYGSDNSVTLKVAVDGQPSID